MSIKTYSIQRASNIMELRNTYDELLDEYYSLYKNYLGYKFSNNRSARTVSQTLEVPTYNDVLVGKTVDPKFPNLEKINTGCAPMCTPDALNIVKNKCSNNPACKGFTNQGELKSNVDDANLVDFKMSIGGFH